MKPRFSKQRTHALTLVELLVVIVVLAVLGVMLLPARSSPRKSLKIFCINNLKQVGLSYKIWAGGHDDKYPMQVSITDTNGGGTLGLASGRNAWVNFAVMSNELSTPKILWCPADKDRKPATNFTVDFNNSKVSYFVNLNVTDTDPQMFFAGDDNFDIGGVPVKTGLLEVSTNTLIAWTTARHNKTGNILLTDGSVQSVNANGLRTAVQYLGLTTNRLAIP